MIGKHDSLVEAKPLYRIAQIVKVSFFELISAGPYDD